VDAQFGKDEKCPLGLKKVTAYTHTIFDDNWKVGMKITPGMNFDKFS